VAAKKRENQWSPRLTEWAAADGRQKRPVVFDNVVDAAPVVSCLAQHQDDTAGADSRRQEASGLR